MEAAAAPRPAFTFQVPDKGNGLVEAIRDSAGAHVPIDSADPRFAAVIEWLGQQPGRGEGSYRHLPAGAKLFTTREQLIARCNEESVSILADAPSDARVSPESVFTPATAHPPSTTLRLLHANIANDLTLWRLFTGSASPYPTALPWFVGHELLYDLEKELTKEDSDVRRVSLVPVSKTFLYVDISDFSTFEPTHQVLILNALNRIVARLRDAGMVSDDFSTEPFEAQLCIGDGYIFVFRDTFSGVVFAAALAHLIETLGARDRIPPFHFRMSVHNGPVLHFWDPGRQDWNYMGQGSIDAERVLSAIGKERDDAVFVSGPARADLLAGVRSRFADRILTHFENRGNQRDKHGRRHRLYELRHMQVVHDLGLVLPQDL